MIKGKKNHGTSNFREVTLLILDILLNVIVIVVLVWIVRKFIIAPFQIYGPSMCNTLNYYQTGECRKGYGEYIIVNKFGYINPFSDKEERVKRGDIVVFHPPNNKENFYIKRVIGLSGETIKIKNGKVYMKKNENDPWIEIEEPYLNNQNKGKTTSSDIKEYKIPLGSYFVMGDNRRASTDSRTCFTDTYSGGCDKNGNTPYITLDNIAGKAWVVLWPPSHMRLMPKTEYSL